MPSTEAVRADRLPPACCWSTTTPCCARAWRTSSTRRPTSMSWPRPATASRRSRPTTGVRPDVTLLDLRMPVMEGVEVVRRLRERDPRARVIVLTTYDTDEEISRALKAGAKAYVLKDISADDLVDVHSRRARRQDLSGARRGGQTRRGRDARAAHAARAGHAAPDGRRQGEQGDRQRARDQRAAR